MERKRTDKLGTSDSKKWRSDVCSSLIYPRLKLRSWCPRNANGYTERPPNTHAFYPKYHQVRHKILNNKYLYNSKTTQKERKKERNKQTISLYYLCQKRPSGVSSVLHSSGHNEVPKSSCQNFGSEMVR